MTHSLAVFCLGFGIAAAAQANQPVSNTSPIRLLLSEVQPGTMASEQYCTLVFADRHFHSEKANRKLGKDRDRKVYEGQLSEADWNTLTGILDNKDFRDLEVPPAVTPLVVEDPHTFAISVARENKYQNMEFLNNKSRKPFESQLKPLLTWWKALRSERVAESKASPDPKCALDSSRGVFAQ